MSDRNDEQPLPDERHTDPHGDVVADGGRSLPRPQPPSRASIWGWRALVLLPLGLGGLKLAGLRDQALSPVAVLLTVICVTALTLGSVRLWQLAPRPRLTYRETMDVYYGIPGPDRRVIHRALRRGRALPPELRADATRYLWASRNQSRVWFPVALAGANLMPTRFLLEDDSALLGLVVVAGVGAFLGAVVLIVLDRRVVQRAHQLGLPLHPGPEPVSSPGTGAS